MNQNLKKGNLLDSPRPGLSSSVWGADGKLHDNLKIQILDLLDRVLYDEGLSVDEWIKKIKIVGSLTSYLYNKNTDLDIHIEVDLPKFMEVEGYEKEEDAKDLLNELRKPINVLKTMLEGTNHPIEVFFEVELQPSPELMGIYNVMDEKWEQEPKVVSADFDIEEIEPKIVEIANETMGELDKELGKAKRDIKSIESLQEVIGAWSGKERKIFEDKLEAKLNSLEEEIINLAMQGQTLIDDRHKNYKEEGEISLTNIKFKYLQRFGYLFIMTQLKELLKDDGKITLDEVPEIKEIITGTNIKEALNDYNDYEMDRTPPPSQVGEGQGQMAGDYHDWSSNSTDFPQRPTDKSDLIRTDQLYSLTMSELKERLKAKGLTDEQIKEIMVSRNTYITQPALPQANPTDFYAYSSLKNRWVKEDSYETNSGYTYNGYMYGDYFITRKLADDELHKENRWLIFYRGEVDDTVIGLENAKKIVEVRTKNLIGSLDKKGKLLKESFRVILAEDVNNFINIKRGSVGTIERIDKDSALVKFDLGEEGIVKEDVKLTSIYSLEKEATEEIEIMKENLSKCLDLDPVTLEPLTSKNSFNKKEQDGFKSGDRVEWSWGKDEVKFGTITDFSDDSDCDIEPGIHASVTEMGSGNKFSVEVEKLKKIVLEKEAMEKKPKVFLGGTCVKSTWRDELIPMLEIDYFNPVVSEWNEEAQKQEVKERKECNFVLYVITSEMEGVYSIAEVIDDSNKRPNTTILCVLYKGFDDKQKKSLQAVEKMVEENKGMVFKTLKEVADYLNKGIIK